VTVSSTFVPRRRWSIAIVVTTLVLVIASVSAAFSIGGPGSAPRPARSAGVPGGPTQPKGVAAPGPEEVAATVVRAESTDPLPSLAIQQSGPAADALRAGLAGALAGNTGCALVVRNNQLIAAVGSGPVVPASTQKLVVAAAALAALGPDYRFVTTVVAPTPVENGTVARLWLVGSGDPMLATSDYGAQVARTDHYSAPAPLTPLEWLASALVQAGVRSVPAGIVGVSTLLPGPLYLPTWTPVEISEHDAGPLSALGVNEGWARWQPLYAASDDPPAEAVGRLESLMRADGVNVGGIAPDGAAPPGAQVIASVTSAPLSSIVAYMLATSDNRIAELLTRMVGARVAGSGTTAAGVAAVPRVVAGLGVPVAGVSMVDGSGLSRQNAATCPELLAAYRLGARPEFAALRAGLPVAGETGGMANEFRGTPAQGRVIAKGGWIDGVAGLVGSVGGLRGVDFAFVVNGRFGFEQSLAIDQRALDAMVAYSNP